MLEKEIENRVCQYAREKGWLAYKFSSPSRVGVPDRIFISPTGKIIFIEFKRKGMKPTPVQEREHDHLIRHNCVVKVVDNVIDGKAIIDAAWSVMT